MEIERTFRLHPDVKFMQHEHYTILAHVGNGAWFKVVPWAATVLSELGALPLDDYVGQVAAGRGQPSADVAQFFQVLEQSDIIQPVSQAQTTQDRRSSGLRDVVWSTRPGPDGLLFAGQAATEFIDALVMSRVQHLVLEGAWAERSDIADLLSLGQMVLGFVLLVMDDVAVSPAICARLQGIPEIIEVQAGDAHLQEAEPLAALGRALALLKDHFFDSLQARVPLSLVEAIGLERVFEVLDPVRVGLNMACFLPTDRDPLCVAGQLSPLAASPERALDLFRDFLAHEVSVGNTHGLQSFYERVLKRTKCTCGAGRGFVVTQADGHIYPCLALAGEDTRIGTWQPGGLLSEATAENPLAAALRGRVVDDIPGCQDCNVRYFCGGGCPANALRAGDLLGRDPLCPVYKKLFGTALSVWQDNELIETNFAAMVEAL